MRNVLITGANGFIGKNLAAALERMEDTKVFKYDLENSLEQLEEFVKEADFIFHLAGINRPKGPGEYESGNKEFTERLIETLKKNERKIRMLLSSSTQAALGNPYGVSKKSAEDAVFDYGRECGTKVYVYRLPNVFGKWCRPGYNSVVATWCYNIPRNIPAQIDNPDTELSLVYIDDVVQECINALNNRENRGADDFCSVGRTFNVSLQKLADTLYSFRNSRKTLVMPDLTGEFERFLYATYLSYLPEEDFAYSLEMKYDNRGWLAEFIKSEHSGQIFLSRTRPGITRGNHWHHTKVEKFLVIEGEAVIRFRQIHGNEVIEYRVSGEQLKVLDIPAGYTHSITNVGQTDVITLFWADEIFNPQKPDTYFLEV